MASSICGYSARTEFGMYAPEFDALAMQSMNIRTPNSHESCRDSRRETSRQSLIQLDTLRIRHLA